MGRVIGIGETVLDILFKNGQPVKAVPGGSVYNSIISLGRMGLDAAFISEVGDDRVGEMILSHLRDSGVGASAVCCFSGGKSPLSLAFLNERNDAEYLFYKDYPNNRLEVEFPKIGPGDIVLYGSYLCSILCCVQRQRRSWSMPTSRVRCSIMISTSARHTLPSV